MIVGLEKKDSFVKVFDIDLNLIRVQGSLEEEIVFNIVV
jgi:hypothetical protein